MGTRHVERCLCSNAWDTSHMQCHLSPRTLALLELPGLSFRIPVFRILGFRISDFGFQIPVFRFRAFGFGVWVFFAFVFLYFCSANAFQCVFALVFSHIFKRFYVRVCIRFWHAFLHAFLHAFFQVSDFRCQIESKTSFFQIFSPTHRWEKAGGTAGRVMGEPARATCSTCPLRCCIRTL